MSNGNNPLHTHTSANSLQYGTPVSGNYGVTTTWISENQGNSVGRCVSIEPVPSRYIDLGMDRVSAMSCLYHVPIIINTIFFNVFQNTIALLYVFVTCPIWIQVPIILLCATATTMQALLARAFKIIETPLHLTFAEEALTSAIKTTLEASKKKAHNFRIELLNSRDDNSLEKGVIYVLLDNQEMYYRVLGTDGSKKENTITAKDLGKNIPTQEQELLALEKDIVYIALKRKEIHHDLVVLISADEYEAMCSASNTNKGKNIFDFDYKLQAIAQEYHTHLHLLAVNEENYRQIDFKKLPIQQHYTQLNYSYNHTYEISYSSAISLKRYLSYSGYRENISSCAIACHVLSSIPTEAFLVILPFLGTTLQGISSLNDVLAHCGVSNIDGYTRLAAILPGIAVGASKAEMTRATKVPSAKERVSKLQARLCKQSDLSQIHQKFERNFCEDFFKLFSCDRSLPIEKKLLIIAYHFSPNLLQFFGYFVAFGTIFFYAGLGLFFSNSGLYELIAFCADFSGHTPEHEVTDYSNVPMAIMSVLMCVAVAILNGFFNQGWEAVKLFKGYAKEARKHIHGYIESKTSTSFCDLIVMPSIIEDIYSKNSRAQNIVLALTLVDSFAASITAYYGSTQIMLAITTLYPPLNVHNLCDKFTVLIAISIYISQTCFSFELYKKDEKTGEDLWGKLCAVHVPESLKTCLGIEDTVKCPHTNGGLDYVHCIYSRFYQQFTITPNSSGSTLNTRGSESPMRFPYNI